MGQQQLLLIVLGVILVGVAVVLGIQYFGVGADEGAKDELVAHNQIIGSNAQEWFRKPVAMGGGGNSWTLTGGSTQTYATYFLNKLTDLQASSNGTYTVTCTDTTVTVVGLPKARGGFNFLNVTTTVSPRTMKTVIN